MKRLDFFILGVQKAGTTALHHYLGYSARVQLPAKKELHIFDNDARGWHTGRFDDLHEPFDWSRDDCIRGEATPIYLYWPNSVERIRDYNPGATCIVMLRHPSFRAHSHWRMERTRGYESMPFAEAIRAGRARVGVAHRIFSYVERGCYAGQLTRLLAHFPREQVVAMRTDALWRSPAAELARLSTRLDIPAIAVDRAEYRVPINTSGTAALHPADRRYLDALYYDDLRRTSDLIELDLDDWLDAHYQEPMAALDTVGDHGLSA